jgi:predicted hotdog family 3-hydroxylacyl-ACP dehydratase
MYEGVSLENVMPHKRSMLLLSRVVASDTREKTLTAEIDITQNSMFYNSEIKQIPVWVGMEYMAQSIAALSGIYAIENNQKPNIGFVLGARNYQCFVTGFNLGETITVKIKELFLDSELGSFSCEIFLGDKLIAKTELNVFQPKSVEEFIRKLEEDK